MKRKEYTLEELFDFDPKRPHHDPKFVHARAQLEIRLFTDNYYVARSEAARSILGREVDYEEGLYFPVTAYTTVTPEARQLLINNLNLFFLSPVTGWAAPLVTHLDWPRLHHPVYGFHPPLRRLPAIDTVEIEQCI